MKHIIWVLWPSFVAAGIAEIVFFTLIDPQQLYLLGRPIVVGQLAAYSIGFFLFWLICAGSSLMTWFMLPSEIKDALSRRAGARDDLARPLQRVP